MTVPMQETVTPLRRRNQSAFAVPRKAKRSPRGLLARHGGQVDGERLAGDQEVVFADHLVLLGAGPATVSPGWEGVAGN
jgi:hypothetical protein